MSTSEKLKKLFSPKFMQKHTSFHSFEDFLKACGIHSKEDLEKHINDEEKMDAHTQAHTKFENWKHMVEQAMNQEIKQSTNDIFWD